MPRTAKDFLEAYRRNLEDGLARQADDGDRAVYLNLALDKLDRMSAAFVRWIRNDKRTNEFPGDMTLFHIEEIATDVGNRLSAIRANARRRIAISEGALSGPVTGAWALAGVAVFGAVALHASPAAAATRETIDVLSTYSFWAFVAIMLSIVGLGLLSLIHGMNRAAAIHDRGTEELNRAYRNIASLSKRREYEEQPHRDAYLDDLAAKTKGR